MNTCPAVQQIAFDFLSPEDAPSEKSSPTMKLRPYQQTAVDTSISAYTKDHVTRQILHMATGTGKTVVFCHLLKQLPPTRLGADKVLIMAHRDELIDQMAHAVMSINPHLSVGIEQGRRMATSDSDVIVASVATLGRKDSTHPQKFNKRLIRFDPDKFKLIAIDEVHHAIADTYKRVLTYFGTDRPDNNKLLWGCTATPNRSDGKGLGKLFDEIVYSYGIINAIEDNWLCRLSAMRVRTETSLAGVKTHMGDFAVNELSDRVNTEQRNDEIVNTWFKHCEGKRHSTMCFCVDVQHVYDLRKAFIDRGVDARGADGSTDKRERRAMVEDFRNEKFPVLINCALWTEGSDFPCMDAIIMARPTKSATMFTQIVGRGTRLYPDKEDCLIIDMVDASSGKDLMTVPSLFGMNPEFDVEGEDVVKVYKKMEKIFEENPAVIQAPNIKEAIRMVEEHVDLFAMGTEDRVTKNSTQYRWRRVGDTYVLDIPVTIDKKKISTVLTISKNMLGKFDIDLHVDGSKKKITDRPDIVGAIYAADHYVNVKYKHSVKLLDKQAGWRSQMITNKQKEFFTKYHIAYNTDMTKGEASDIIDKKILEFKRKQARGGVRRGSGNKMYTRVDNVKVGRIGR